MRLTNIDLNISTGSATQKELTSTSNESGIVVASRNCPIPILTQKVANAVEALVQTRPTPKNKSELASRTSEHLEALKPIIEHVKTEMEKNKGSLFAWLKKGSHEKALETLTHCEHRLRTNMIALKIV